MQALLIQGLRDEHGRERKGDKSKIGSVQQGKFCGFRARFRFGRQNDARLATWRSTREAAEADRRVVAAAVAAAAGGQAERMKAAEAALAERAKLPEAQAHSPTHLRPAAEIATHGYYFSLLAIALPFAFLLPILPFIIIRSSRCIPLAFRLRVSAAFSSSAFLSFCHSPARSPELLGGRCAVGSDTASMRDPTKCR